MSQQIFKEYKVCDLIICGYFFIGFIDFMVSNKRLTDSTNFFFPDNFKKNDEIILKCF